MLETKQTIYGPLKFGKKQHILAFRNNGLLYTKSLAEFAKLETDLERGDCFESTDTIIQPKHVGECMQFVGQGGPR